MKKILIQPNEQLLQWIAINNKSYFFNNFLYCLLFFIHFCLLVLFFLFIFLYIGFIHIFFFLFIFFIILTSYDVCLFYLMIVIVLSHYYQMYININLFLIYIFDNDNIIVCTMIVACFCVEPTEKKQNQIIWFEPFIFLMLKK